MEYYQHCKHLSAPTMLMFLTAAPSAPDGQQCEHGLWVWQLWGQRKIALLAWTPLMTSLENRRTDKSKESEQERRKVADVLLQLKILIHEQPVGILWHNWEGIGSPFIFKLLWQGNIGNIFCRPGCLGYE